MKHIGTCTCCGAPDTVLQFSWDHDYATRPICATCCEAAETAADLAAAGA